MIRPPLRHVSRLDRLLAAVGRALSDQAGAGAAVAHRPSPAGAVFDADPPPPSAAPASPGAPAAPGGPGTAVLSEAERRHAAGLMRVNHVGEVCAQALYQGHAATVREPALARLFLTAADEERDHLAWTAARLSELRARPSRLMPLWHAGALSIGAAAGLAGGSRALGFMAETERQVEAHLAGHLERLPVADTRSRAIVEQMRLDEARHGRQAIAAGGRLPPRPIAAVMRLAAKAMTTIAYRI
ncbi:MAG: 2-polyprenyl-3-methyl-6-methoxy-1,4-benzoquinone monooxygenase [Lautropia sp.]